jgi:hypothetical protein
MPVVSEESPKKRGWNLWPLWVAGSLLFLLLGGVGLLPLTGYYGNFGRVRVTCVRAQPPPKPLGCAWPEGYTRVENGGSTYHGVRLGSWHWVVQID